MPFAMVILCGSRCCWRPSARARAIAAVAVAYLTWWATAFTLESYQFNEMATGLVVIPIWIPQATFVIGCWLLLATVLDELLTVAQGQRPHYQQAVEERHARGDFSADV